MHFSRLHCYEITGVSSRRINGTTEAEGCPIGLGYGSAKPPLHSPQNHDFPDSGEDTAPGRCHSQAIHRRLSS